MTATTKTNLEQNIKTAKEKLGLKSDLELRKYLPWDDGRQMHHFSFKKLAKDSPEQLAELISSNILDVDSPAKIAPAPRSRRDSGKLKLSRGEIGRLIGLVRTAGDGDLLEKLSSQVDSYSAIKKELMAAIRRDEADETLWRAFSEKLASRS